MIANQHPETRFAKGSLTCRTKGTKATISERRLFLRSLTWEKVKQLAQHVVNTSPAGEQTRMARELGTTDSQIHRFLCEDCAHDQEPIFTTGFALLTYCLARLSAPEIVQVKDFKPIGKRKSGGSGRTRNYSDSLDTQTRMYGQIPAV